ncbi:TIR domain-containing protein [Azohydromonas aeria]|uniref:TIR domain-containing protein n=1 Tax=Azohydromonas aeria TaxID=2590212 RepID=UPI0012F7D4EE|nr:nucleotide-binding protein [Azohydromonas aeria]
MNKKAKLFISVPDDRHLDSRRQSLKRSIIAFIQDSGFEVIGFESEQWGVTTPPLLNDWSVERASALLRRCDGAVVLGLARSHVHVLKPGIKARSKTTLISQPQPTPYNHLEGGLAISLGLPVLILLEEDMDRSGLFASGIKPSIIPKNVAEQWVNSSSFTNHFNAWAAVVCGRRDVFLGYCSKASPVAMEIRDYLENNNFSVVDWSRDFKPSGATILEEIERASERCRSGIFLFTKDDEIQNISTGKASFDAIPRDNVLLEAGFFTRSHGKGRIAIIREAGAKMPADFGGIIYISFNDRSDLVAAKEKLIVFLTEALGRGD